MAVIHGQPALTFMGVALGENSTVRYSIEEEETNPPRLDLALRREGSYLVLDGNPTNAGISSEAIAGKIAEEKVGLERALSGAATGVMNGVGMSGTPSICMGYMVLRFTPRAAEVAAPSFSKGPIDPKEAKKLKSMQYAMQMGEIAAPAGLTQDLVLASAYNVMLQGKSGQKSYAVHAKGVDGGQVHVEQILAYKLRAFLGYLKNFREGPGRPFNLENINIEGRVYFRFTDGTHTSGACAGCKGVWGKLKQEYPCAANIEPVKD
ncbi:hypothetical protein [Paraburkholderia sacchari]|uniref:hypothetical protein n=1 Tax=Paraburkholderia sacchari TaxID=159450 RepID=UPI001BCCE7CA|nr:hypothetical protein [Paraburkholderia sacchari]